MLVGCKNTCFWVSLWLTVKQFLSVILNNTSRELKGKAERQGGQGQVKAQVLNLYRTDLLKYCVHLSFPLHVRTTRNWILDPADAGGRECSVYLLVTTQTRMSGRRGSWAENQSKLNIHSRGGNSKIQNPTTVQGPKHTHKKHTGHTGVRGHIKQKY